MRYFELICTAYIKKEIPFKESFELLSKYISFCMVQTDSTKDRHYQKGYKYYSFGSFYPIEKDRLYKKSNSYQFTLRSPDEHFINALQTTLRENINNPYLLVVTCSKKSVKQFFINELYTLTPTIITVENGRYWTCEQDGDILKLQRQLHDNLEKKYHDFYGESLQPTVNFIQLLEVKNQKPQSIFFKKNGKSVRLFGNKFRIVPSEDKVSQRLAFLALSCGLGEKNSFGGGFCVGKGLNHD
jgi:CRISPR-associated endoribonuclease Cas6